MTDKLREAAEKADKLLETIWQSQKLWSLEESQDVQEELRAALQEPQQEPEISVDRDQDGDVEIDFYCGKGMTLTAAVKQDGVVDFAYHWNGHKNHGRLENAKAPPTHKLVPIEPTSPSCGWVRNGYITWEEPPADKLHLYTVYEPAAKAQPPEK